MNSMRKTFLTIIIISALIGSLVLVQAVKIAEAETLGPLRLTEDDSSRITIFSPQNTNYYENSILVKFTVTAFIYLYEVGYSLDDEVVQRIDDLAFIKSEPSRGYSPNGVTNDVTYEGKIYLTDLNNGNHSLTIYQGHQYPDSYHVYQYSSVNFTIDSKPPNISISIENRTYNQKALPLNFTVDKQVSWAGYSLDNQDNMTLIGNSTLYSISDGAHSIVIYANDTAGNMGKSTPVRFTIETKPNPTQSTTPTPTPTPEPTATAISTPSTSQQPAQKPETNENSNTLFEIDIATAILTALTIAAVATIIVLRRRRNSPQQNQ